jgi:hypothetical protein
VFVFAGLSIQMVQYERKSLLQRPIFKFFEE